MKFILNPMEGKLTTHGILRISLFTLISILVLFVSVVGAQELIRQYEIDDVLIEGNRRIDTAAVKAQLKGSFGRVSTEIISEDIKTLYNTGFFDQVKVSVVQSGGRNILKYSLVEKPIVRKVFIRGNKEVDEEDLADPLKLGTSRFLDNSKIDTITKNLTAYYQSKGYYDVSFEHSVVPEADNQVDLTFTVTEGKRYKIEKVEVRGLKNLDEDDILSVIQTKRYKWYNSWLFSTGRVNKEMLENDKAIIRQYFLDHGYIDGNVSDALVEPEKDEEGELLVIFDVVEGDEYKIGKVDVSGDLIDGDKEKTLADIKAKQDSVFNASALREDTFKISDKFTDVGYAFANVVPNTAVNRQAKKVDVDFNVNKGGIVAINRINIRGNNKTYDNVIRRTLKISEQETYSSSKIKRSQELLQRLGYFEEVNISSQPTENQEKVDLLVNVREGSTGTFTAGAGFSSSDGALFSTRVAENNIFGTGRSVNLTGEFGTERDNIVLGFNDPRLNDSYMALGAQALRTDREFSDFDRRLAGANTTLGYPLEQVFEESKWAEDISAYLKYEYLDINISNVDVEDAAQLVIDSQGTSTSSAITPSIVRNTINNPLNPSKGSRQSLSVELAGLGGSEDYTLFEARNQWYAPVIESPEHGDLTFSLRTTFAYGVNDGEGEFPLFRRFFPGGINSVRGYKNRSLGPKDAEGNEYGGAKELINNAELIFPLLNSAGLKGVVFYDVGQAFDDDESIEINKLREAYGFGIRWFSPLGPIRIEFGFPIDREEDEKSMVTQFSFGAPL